MPESYESSYIKVANNRMLESVESFYFRDIHERVFLGTASDRYAGWIGQIYSPHLYEGKITRRTKRLKGAKLVEEVLPVESIREYFEHFKILELDFTFYSLLLDDEGKSTRVFRTLIEYQKNMNGKGQLILKVPQIVFARKLMRKGYFIDNERYLDTETFVEKFYEPAVALLGNCVRGFVFEQEYQRKTERVSLEQLAGELDRFFGNIPDDDRYHVELRTGDFLCEPIFRVLEKHGVGQVLSHWTWLPRLKIQYQASGEKFLNSGKNCVIRLMTPSGMKYEDAFVKAYPFNRLLKDMLDPQMIDDTVDIMRRCIRKGVDVNVIINNRAGGNAPELARMIAKKFINLS